MLSPDVLQFSTMATLGIYIQVPFCQTKCTYCNFHTGVVSADRFSPYMHAVCREISSVRELSRAAGVVWPESFDWQTLRQTPIPHATVDTVYIGGGTPSLLEPRLLDTLLHALRDSFACDWQEVTLEADPETIEGEKAHQWASSGIDRISFGSQSFVDEELKAAGRMHRCADIYKAVPILRDAGIQNISFDLIAGLPKQTPLSWRHSLAETIALSPEHVSIYMMEIDEGSRLGLEVLQQGTRYSVRELPSEEAMADFYALAQRQLAAAGYEQYEISNWAKPGFASKHNLKYWRREPYLGFGAGAHSFSGKQRWANVHDAKAYVAALEEGKTAIDSVQPITLEEALEEEIFLGLRQLGGIDVARIERQYGIDLQEKISRLASIGVVEREGDVLRLAPARLSVSNEVLVELLR
jgi:putative oxygen-independent coproporphyrinogen III oxidase